MQVLYRSLRFVRKRNRPTNWQRLSHQRQSLILGELARFVAVHPLHEAGEGESLNAVGLGHSVQYLLVGRIPHPCSRQLGRAGDCLPRCRAEGLVYRCHQLLERDPGGGGCALAELLQRPGEGSP